MEYLLCDICHTKCKVHANCLLRWTKSSSGVYYGRCGPCDQLVLCYLAKSEDLTVTNKVQTLNDKLSKGVKISFNIAEYNKTKRFYQIELGKLFGKPHYFTKFIR